jgi:hypothetical protein
VLCQRASNAAEGSLRRRGLHGGPF